MSTRPLKGCLLFDGDEVKYQLWEVKFLGYMRQRKLYEVITSGEDTPDEAKHANAFTKCDPSGRNQSHVGRVRFPLRAEMHGRAHITDSCFIAFITSKIC